MADKTQIPSTTRQPPRVGSKLDAILKLLRQPGGSTLDRMVKTTGWQSHAVRAALSRLRQRGFQIERQSTDGKPSRYHLRKAA